MANVNVTYGDMQSAAGQLKAGEQQINSDLARLKKLIDNRLGRPVASAPDAHSAPADWLVKKVLGS